MHASFASIIKLLLVLLKAINNCVNLKKAYLVRINHDKNEALNLKLLKYSFYDKKQQWNECLSKTVLQSCEIKGEKTLIR